MILRIPFTSFFPFLKFLTVSGVSLSLLSCGGSGESESGDCLLNGAILDLTVTLEREDETSEKYPFLLKLTGTGSDLPLVSINSNSSNKDATMNAANAVYRRNGSSATLRGNFTLASGEYTISGPIIVTIYDKCYVNVNISFDSSDPYESCEGTFTGNITYETFPDDAANQVNWICDSGEVSYKAP